MAMLVWLFVLWIGTAHAQVSGPGANVIVTPGISAVKTGEALSSSYGTLAAAVTALGSTDAVDLYITSASFPVGSTTTVTPNITLHKRGAGTLACGTAVLTIKGAVTVSPGSAFFDTSCAEDEVEFQDNYSVERVPILWFEGCTVGGSVDCSASWKKARASVTGSATHYMRKVLLPAGKVRVDSAIINNCASVNDCRGIQYIGAGGEQTEVGGGTSVLCRVDGGACIENGADNSDDGIAANYDGPQMVRLEGMALIYDGSSTTALANGEGNFGTTAIGFRDWRGGDVNFVDVLIRGFKYGIWVTRSDFNRNDGLLRLTANQVGAYWGPRSDFLDLRGMRSRINDTAMIFDRVQGGVISQWASVEDGSDASPALIIGVSNASAPGSKDLLFVKPSFEHFETDDIINASVEIGSDATRFGVRYNGGGSPVGANMSDNITFISPEWRIETYTGAIENTKYGFEIGNAKRTGVDRMQLLAGTFSKTFNFVGAASTQNQTVSMYGNENDASYATYDDNSSAGTPSVSGWGLGNSQITGWTDNGRLLWKTPAAADQNFDIRTTGNVAINGTNGVTATNLCSTNQVMTKGLVTTCN